MSVRAKFRCAKVDEGSVRLEPVVGGSPENESFFAATPGGQIELAIVNKSALLLFEIGEEYYVDFSRAQ